MTTNDWLKRGIAVNEPVIENEEWRGISNESFFTEGRHTQTNDIYIVTDVV